MMPSNRRPIDHPTLANIQNTVPPSAHNEPADTLDASADSSIHHCDYDLRALVVPGLEHYVEHDDAPRFHVR